MWEIILNISFICSYSMIWHFGQLGLVLILRKIVCGSSEITITKTMILNERNNEGTMKKWRGGWKPPHTIYYGPFLNNLAEWPNLKLRSRQNSKGLRQQGHLFGLLHFDNGANNIGNGLTASMSWLPEQPWKRHPQYLLAAQLCY